jgi:serine/threonine protein kinase
MDLLKQFGGFWSMMDRVGQRFGNYQLLRLLGKGGFAEVYLGEHIYLKSLAAIKVLLTRVGDEEANYFIAEARLLIDLRHPHIVRVLEFGVENDIPFLVMDYAPNGTLRQRHPKNTHLSPATIIPYVKQIASALQYAHDQKLIHRDVKPENLLLQRNDEILLSDFGIALIARSSHYHNSEGIIGTVAYMAPEQIQGKPTFSSDQYSLGVVVYEWLSGISPFQGSFYEICTQHMFTPPAPLRQTVPMLSANIESAVMTALAKEPQQRFTNVIAFAAALEHACQTDPSVQVTLPPFAPDPHPLASSPDGQWNNVALRSLMPAAQQPYTAPALDENSALAADGGKWSAPGERYTLLSEAGQAPIAEKNASLAEPEGKPVYAANRNSGVVTRLPWRKTQRRIPPKAFMIALSILVVFLSINGLLYYALFYHSSQAHTGTQVMTPVRASATPQPSATPRPSATSRPTTTTPPTAILQANPTQSIATSPPQPAPTPTTQTGATLVLNDPLTTQDANQWDVFSYAGGVGGCGFTNGAYHATITQTGSFGSCMARATNFANFTYQVQMTILSGTTYDGGGLIFRANSGAAYRFRVGVNGSFDLVDQVQSLISSSSPAIKTGLNQTNLLAVVAKGSSISLYVNRQLIANVQDSISSSGEIGMLAVDFSMPTDVAFSHARVWVTGV